MKKNFKIDLSWKQRIIAMFFTALIYGIVIYFLNTNRSLESAILQGVIFGALFMLLFPWTLEKMIGKRVDTILPELLENEKIEEEIFANLFRGIEGVGGKIFLTNERLIFKSHSLNIQKGQTNIDYSEISSVGKRKTMKIINNGIKILTNKGQEYCFVVNDRESQIQKISIKLV
jgi:hypothetical protein